VWFVERGIVENGIDVVAQQSQCADTARNRAQHGVVKSLGPLVRHIATIVLDFAYDVGGPGKGGTGTLFANGERVGQGRIDVTQCCVFSATEGADVGLNTGTPVSPEYTNPFTFNGTIEKVTIDLKDSKATGDAKRATEEEQTQSRMKRAVSN
jgi:arylsulfatase